MEFVKEEKCVMDRDLCRVETSTHCAINNVSETRASMGFGVYASELHV